MKINRLVAQISVMAFLVSLAGIAGAVILPDQGAEYTMAGDSMALDSGGANFTLKHGQTITITHAGMTWTLTATADTSGHVQVRSDDCLLFTYDSEKLTLVAPAAAAACAAGAVGGLTSGSAAVIGGGAAAAVAAGAAVGLSGGKSKSGQ